MTRDKLEKTCAIFTDRGFPKMFAAANKEATEPRVPFDKVEVITSTMLPWPP